MHNRMRWLPFPTQANPKVWISANDDLANGLKLYNPYSSKGRIAKQWFVAIHTLGKRYLQPRFRPNESLDALSDTLDAMLNQNGLVYSYSMGTPGPHRKITAQVSRHNRPIAYAKIGTTPQSNILIRREHSALKLLRELGLTSALTPQPLSFSESVEQTILCQSAPPTTVKTRPIGPTPQDSQFLKDLVTATRSCAPISNVIQYILQSESNGLSHKAMPETLLDAIDYVSAIFSNKPVQTVFGHGDYAPWNTYWTSAQSLYVFDWEYGEHNKPLLNDFFHYLYMPARLIHRIKPSGVARILLEIDRHRVFGSTVTELNIDVNDVAAYALLYLLTHAARQYSSGLPYDAYIIECMYNILTTTGTP